MGGGGRGCSRLLTRGEGVVKWGGLLVRSGAGGAPPPRGMEECAQCDAHIPRKVFPICMTSPRKIFECE